MLPLEEPEEDEEELEGVPGFNKSSKLPLEEDEDEELEEELELLEEEEDVDSDFLSSIPNFVLIVLNGLIFSAPKVSNKKRITPQKRINESRYTKNLYRPVFGFWLFSILNCLN
ncbi:MAG: hypothetical protein OHK0017_08600 [Patescibacteria group bacterium]